MPSALAACLLRALGFQMGPVSRLEETTNTSNDLAST
jgi:hypothetical protein